jgi:flagellar P-ring protein precursor FlgI
MRRLTTILAALALAGSVFAQAGNGSSGNTGTVKTAEQIEQENQAKAQSLAMQKAIIDAEREGVNVRMKDIGRFRGVRPNMLQGYGLVVGLAGTGDSQQTPFTATLLENALRRWGTSIDASKFRPKNIAVVSITAELPAFAAPGNAIDVTVSSLGDAKSLEGGTLLLSPLYGPSDFETVMAVTQGPVSIGGFNASAGGASTRKNHTNVGRIPGGALVERGVDTQVLFEGNKLFFELYLADLTTAQRVATAIKDDLPGYVVKPIDGGTIEITIPDKDEFMLSMSKIEQTFVKADVPAVVVVNERTGTVVIGGNVRLGPAVIAHGSLQVRVEAFPFVSQPNSFNNSGQTTTGEQTFVNAQEDPVQIGILAPNTTINDLAKILQTLQVSARDIIAILQALAEQGALKAKIKIQ